MTDIRRWIVSALETACIITHYPPLTFFPGHCQLAKLSDNLDQRWGAGVWTP